MRGEKEGEEKIMAGVLLSSSRVKGNKGTKMNGVKIKCINILFSIYKDNQYKNYPTEKHQAQVVSQGNSTTLSKMR